MSAAVSNGNIEVQEVVRREGAVEKVVIKNWPFVMIFFRVGKEVKMTGFIRYDGCQDEFYRIPKRYFVPAIKRARAIFNAGSRRASI